LSKNGANPFAGLFRDSALVQVRHVKVEDGPGRTLGRSFGVRLWPNFVLLKDGVVLRQLARPSATELKEAFAALG
jgi:thioredoxin 1